MSLKQKITNNVPPVMDALGRILEKIHNGDFADGKRVKESVLAKELNLGRNAVRTALSQLDAWNIVKYVPYCGYQMQEITIHSLLDWMELRAAIEPIAARRLAKKCPPEVLSKLEKYIEDYEKAMAENDAKQIWNCDFNFHLTVTESCGNNLLQKLYVALPFFYRSMNNIDNKNLLYTVENSTSELLPEHFTKTEFDEADHRNCIEDHRKLLRLIREGKVDETEAAFHKHAINQVRNVEKIIQYMELYKNLSQMQFFSPLKEELVNNTQN